MINQTPGAIQSALQEAAKALVTLANDIRISNTKPRQRTLTAHVREAMDTVDWVIDYDSTPCGHKGA